MELLLKLTPAEDIQQHVLPMLYRGLDCESPQIHELCLSVLPTFAGLLDHSNVKNSLLPRIKKLCLSTSTLSVRVNCLLCVGKLLENLDKWLVLDEVLPFLPQIPSREPAVLMGILGIYKIALTHKKLGITKEIIASRVLPFLIPLCIENGLTLQQFNALTSLVKEMFQIVENEHRTKLEQLNSVKDEQKVLASTAPVTTPKSRPMELDKAFTGLGLDSFVSSGSIRSKPNVMEDSLKVFNTQPSLEPVKTTTTPKNNHTAALNNWVSAPKISSPPSASNSSTTNIGSFVMSPSNSQNLSAMNQNQWGNNGSRNSITSPTGQNQWNSTARSFNSNHNNWSNNMTQSNSPFQSVNENVANANPWGSSQPALTYNKTDNSQNWSALDNLLPMSTNNAAKVPMNMISPKQPLIPSPNNNPPTLSKDDIMDLLS